MKSRILGVLALLVLVFALTACNGSGGSDSSSSNGSGGGSVAAAPLMGAKVYGKTASKEVVLIGTTDSNGAFTANANVNKLTFPAVVYSEGGTTKHTQKKFGGSLKGVLKSANGKVYLTPANTFVAEIFDARKRLKPEMNQAEILEELKETETSIKRLIQVEMGLSQDTDPLGDPLGANLVNSETVSKNLLMQIAAGDEDNENAMEDLESKIFNIAQKMVNEDQTFSKVVEDTPGTPLNLISGSKTLNELVRDPATVESIKKQVTNTLGEENVDSNELDECTAAKETKDLPTSLFLEIKKEAEETVLTRAVTVPYDGSNIGFTTPVQLRNASGTATTGAVYKATFTNMSVTNTSSGVVESGKAFVPAIGDKLTFDVLIPENPTLPMTASITIEAMAQNVTFSKTFVVTCIGNEDFAVEKVEYTGKIKVFEFGTEFNKDGLIHEGESAEVDPADFKGLVTLINKSTKDDVDAKLDVQFEAPDGFVFGDNLDNTDTMVIEEFTADCFKKYSVNSSFPTMTAAKDVKPGTKKLTIKVIDSNGATVDSTIQELAFVRKKTSQAVIAASLKEITSSQKGDIKKNTTLEVANEYLTPNGEEKTFTSDEIVLKGEYQTWETKMGEESPGKWSRLPDEAQVCLVSTSGKKPFKDAYNVPTDKFVVPNEKVTFSGTEFSLDATIENFSYTFTGKNVDANDDIKLVLIYDTTHPEDNIDASGFFKLKFAKPTS